MLAVRKLESGSRIESVVGDTIGLEVNARDLVDHVMAAEAIFIIPIISSARGDVSRRRAANDLGVVTLSSALSRAGFAPTSGAELRL
jgi:hypothetical protein